MTSSHEQKSRNTVETVLITLLLLVLLYSLYTVLQVFFGVFTYAIIFAVSFSGLFNKLSRVLGNKRTLAAVIYCLLLIAIMALPFLYAIRAINDMLVQAEVWITGAKDTGIPALPTRLTTLPLVGDDINTFWEKLRQNPKGTIGLYEAQITVVLQRLLSGGAGLIGAGVEFIAGVIISAVFLVKGDTLLKPIRASLSYMIGEKDGPALLDAAGKAVRGVAIGVMGTAIIAGVASYIGFAIAGLSIAVILAAITFLFVLIQVGPLPVMIPVVIWMFVEDKTGWGIFMVVWTVGMFLIDNVLKPILIAKSGKLPVLVLFLGVIGGMVTWGFTGMFKGAIILALFYTIFTSWLQRKTGHDSEAATA